MTCFFILFCRLFILCIYSPSRRIHCSYCCCLCMRIANHHNLCNQHSFHEWVSYTPKWLLAGQLQNTGKVYFHFEVSYSWHIFLKMVANIVFIYLLQPFCSHCNYLYVFYFCLFGLQAFYITDQLSNTNNVILICFFSRLWMHLKHLMASGTLKLLRGTVLQHTDSTILFVIPLMPKKAFSPTRIMYMLSP